MNSAKQYTKYSEFCCSLYTNNSQREKLRKKIPCIPAPERIKCLGINLTKEVKDLYSGNYKTLKKFIEKDPDKWNNKLCSWVEKN